MSEQLLTRRDITERAGIGNSTLGDWQRKYGLTPAGHRGKAVLYRWSDVQAAKRRRDEAEAARKAERRAAAPKPPERRKKEAYSNQRLSMALDVEDLAHMTGRGDVDLKTWARVCAGRFSDEEPSYKTMKRALERWKRRLRNYRIPFCLVNYHGEPVGPNGSGLYGDDEALIRFDWPNALRWTRRVLG